MSPWPTCSRPWPSATHRDREREHGALRVADDAFEVDTTGRTVDDVIAGVVELARERRIA